MGARELQHLCKSKCGRHPGRFSKLSKRPCFLLMGRIALLQSLPVLQIQHLYSISAISTISPIHQRKSIKQHGTPATASPTRRNTLRRHYKIRRSVNTTKSNHVCVSTPPQPRSLTTPLSPRSRLHSDSSRTLHLLNTLCRVLPQRLRHNRWLVHRDCHSMDLIPIVPSSVWAR